VAGSREHGNEPSGSIKYCELLKYGDWRRVKKDPAPWSRLDIMPRCMRRMFSP
jgi:hypothetical protein